LANDDCAKLAILCLHHTRSRLLQNLDLKTNDRVPLINNLPLWSGFLVKRYVMTRLLRDLVIVLMFYVAEHCVFLNLKMHRFLSHFGMYTFWK
jgi:hypothetical protein